MRSLWKFAIHEWYFIIIKQAQYTKIGILRFDSFTIYSIRTFVLQWWVIGISTGHWNWEMIKSWESIFYKRDKKMIRISSILWKKGMTMKCLVARNVDPVLSKLIKVKSRSVYMRVHINCNFTIIQTTLCEYPGEDSINFNKFPSTFSPM